MNIYEQFFLLTTYLIQVFQGQIGSLFYHLKTMSTKQDTQDTFLQK